MKINNFKEPPKFKSKKEEALFWDKHSTEDFPEFWEDVKNIKISKKLRSVYKQVMPIRLDEETKKSVVKIARQKGIGVSTAARMLIRERLAELKVS